ncbi:UDP-glucose dehydrogenase family protein [Corynebacterium pseudodiphtheriticum]|uniref:UDP-glucose dehydrogenase family protein n=1 Tax=Corynebacterium pseudodiphtheriticum TaxID=37637 RepID=UPI00254085CE|nr:UDP-glucose/GDP-mannose dehydrogenase family protein [Corynebacterium pseudodiphtheriticum]MDK4207693.1 UDP-glucose/GDP-mannose dehydrogenase family protein [Corynebacterium pseudodiphtheriticum]MDK4285048.1 UDP-glucose/GDP-mannose dehydrogenase family protein [Corynebacterium pseudodiphtheriticum]MDK4339631.1 UDP-glucose/GDP-mannose dehydrogenase family protein [Corynebacterium pseudodiphtheriticum]MDK8684625.1 UDP-glucose/GDP-mannose dehydrogenase family protein [Corynebacterium pseudodiph
MHLTVFGLGYLGLTHAACMAEAGHEVLGVDIAPARVAQLQAARVPFYEPGLAELVARGVESGRLRFSCDYRQAAEFAQLHFIAVGTPERADSPAADTSAVEAVVDQLAPLLRGKHVLVGKSTVPVGTAARLQERAANISRATVDILWNPEFLREGHAVADTLRPDRIVVGTGAAASSAVETLREVYRAPLERGTPFLVMPWASAELVKSAANAFLATKISFINAIAEVCEAVGGDVAAVAEALGYDERIGHQYLGAGLGFGGGCLPKDLRAFRVRADECGAGDALAFLGQVELINARRRQRVVQLASELVAQPSKVAEPAGSARPGLSGAIITVLGAAFKPNSDDVRDSPALHVAAELALRGARVRVCDPQAVENARRVYPGLEYPASLADGVAGADLVILATEWREYRELDPVWAAELVAEPVLIDARNALDLARWRGAGWQVHALGRGD